MSTYSPNGAGHHALAVLDNGPANFVDVMDALGITNPRRARKTAAHVQVALKRDGLAEHVGSWLAITTLGLEALEQLRAGENFHATQPTVRVFVRQPESQQVQA